jgi:hypothetical protein
VRSEAVFPFVAAAALHFALIPAGAAPVDRIWVHLCGSDGAIPLPFPARPNKDLPAACHAGCALTPEKKKPGRL